MHCHLLCLPEYKDCSESSTLIGDIFKSLGRLDKPDIMDLSGFSIALQCFCNSYHKAEKELPMINNKHALKKLKSIKKDLEVLEKRLQKNIKKHIRSRCQKKN